MKPLDSNEKATCFLLDNMELDRASLLREVKSLKYKRAISHCFDLDDARLGDRPSAQSQGRYLCEVLKPYVLLAH